MARQTVVGARGKNPLCQKREVHMKVNCLSCGHYVDLDDSYSDYEGAIKCYACDATLEVKLSDGQVKSVKLQEKKTRLQPSEKGMHGI